MALFENFPYTNLHELNLDWLIENIKKLEASQVLSVNGETGHVILYQSENMQLPDVESNVWQIIRTTDGVTAGIHFNSTTGMATIVNGETLDQIYTHDHPPVYPVYSVNGQTGAVVTYPEQYVRLPDLDDAQMTNWTLFRHLNNVSRGIQFDDDGSVYVIDDLNRYKIFTQHTGDTPPYPVTSVNGSTGDVTLYTDQYVRLPDLSDNTMTDWTLFRMLNSVVVGLKLDDNGSVSVLNGNDEYPVYIEGINDPSDFNDPTDAVLELSEDVALADGKTWGMVRTVEDGNSTVGIVFKYNTITSEYETYQKVGSTETKLLTAADIPPGSGVLSVQGQTGAVVLTGDDLHVSISDTDSISTAIGNIQDDIVDLSYLPEEIAIVVTGDTATQNITAGNFVVVKASTITGITDGLYIALNNITANTPLTSVDLDNTNTGKGGLNTILDKFGYIEYTNKVTPYQGRINITEQYYRVYNNGRRELYLRGTLAQALSSAQATVAVLDDNTAHDTATDAVIGAHGYPAILIDISGTRYINFDHTGLSNGLNFGLDMVFYS